MIPNFFLKKKYIVHLHFRKYPLNYTICIHHPFSFSLRRRPSFKPIGWEIFKFFLIKYNDFQVGSYTFRGSHPNIRIRNVKTIIKILIRKTVVL